MKVYANYRQTGKTTRLIKRSAETGYVIVTYNNLSKRRIGDMAKGMGLTIPEPILYDEIIIGTKIPIRNPKVTKILIDDAEQFIKRSVENFGVVVDSITLSYDESQDGTMISKTELEKYKYLKGVE